MKLSHLFIERLMKLCFSAVILQLLYISVCMGADVHSAQPLTLFNIADTMQMLEYAAMSAVVTLGGALALEYALKTYS